MSHRKEFCWDLIKVRKKTVRSDGSEVWNIVGLFPHTPLGVEEARILTDNWPPHEFYGEVVTHMTFTWEHRAFKEATPSPTR
jgi:hypothetical protein